MKKRNIELCILCILILCSVAGLTWYALRREPQPESEPFQTASARAFSTPTTAANFWDLMAKQNEPATAAKITKVSDPDPNDENDPLPLTFPKNISIYSLAFYGDVTAARAGLFTNYDDLQKALSTAVYDQRKVTAWTVTAASPKIQTCSQLDALKAVIQTQLALVKKTMQDISGAQVVTSKMKDENMAQQLKLSGLCQVVPPPDICKTLATQDGPMFPLLGQYNMTNDALAGNEEDIQNALQTVNDTFSVLGCVNPKLSFDSESDAGYINTEELQLNLQRMSPYYLSPDTLKSITAVIVPGGAQLSAPISTTADALVDITNVIKNIKILTNTT